MDIASNDNTALQLDSHPPLLSTRSVEERLQALEAAIERIEPRTVCNKVTIVVFSGEMTRCSRRW